MKRTTDAALIMTKGLFGKNLTLFWLAMACMGIVGASWVFTGPALAEPGLKNRILVVHVATDDPAAANMAVMFANNMQDKGKPVVLFLDVKGVGIGVKTPPKNLEDAASKVKTFLNNGGRVLVCHHCLGMAGFKEDDLLPSAELGIPERMYNLFQNNPIVIDY
jgi:predicted peroxiredoxin